MALREPLRGLPIAADVEAAVVKLDAEMRQAVKRRPPRFERSAGLETFVDDHKVVLQAGIVLAVTLGKSAERIRPVSRAREIDDCDRRVHDPDSVETAGFESFI